MDEWILSHWNAVWGVLIYSYRVFHDLCYGGSSREHKFEKLKNIGPDLYWISVVIWGIILLNLDSKYLCSLLGKTAHFRILVLLILIGFLGLIINKLKQIADNFVGGAIKSKKQVASHGAIYLVIHIVGFGSLLFALYAMGK